MRRARLLLLTVWMLAFAILPSQAQTDSTEFYPAADSLRSGPLVSAATAMETAWDLVRNPLSDALPGDGETAAFIRRGFRMFIQTKAYAPRLTGNDLSCGHCHINAGQREKALPVVGVSSVYPEFNKRSGTVFSLADRIAGCFMRSMNGPADPTMLAAHDQESVHAQVAGSEEVKALAAYIDWLSEGYAKGGPLPWRGLNMIAESSLVALDRLDSARGGDLFLEKCSNCHGEDGQGVAIGDIKAGPLWGPASWNDGAGATRVYTLAGMIRYMMPYIDPGSLTDEEAQHIAYFIALQPRPAYPFKSADYRDGNIPPDALAYKKGP